MSAADDRSLNYEHLCKAWSTLGEYDDFRRLARFRRKLEQQLRDANIPLTHVPWKSMVRSLLCRDVFDSKQLTEMNANTAECCTNVDGALSETIVQLLLDDDREDNYPNLTEVWYELDQLKQHFQQAVDMLPNSQNARKEMLHRILGYPAGMNNSDHLIVITLSVFRIR